MKSQEQILALVEQVRLARIAVDLAYDEWFRDPQDRDGIRSVTHWRAVQEFEDAKYKLCSAAEAR